MAQSQEGCRSRADHIVLAPTLATRNEDNVPCRSGCASSSAPIALIVLVVVWALVAMAVAQAPFIFDNMIASIAYYVIAGIGWVLPAMPIVSWMSRPQITGRLSRDPGGGNRSTSRSPSPDSKTRT